ncbi:MAG: DUF4349 domain-containing protein [Rickettsiales bacterium]|nr:DUF4349 domain-containing protein [Rickettsiales bacterium]
MMKKLLIVLWALSLTACFDDEDRISHNLVAQADMVGGYAMEMEGAMDFAPAAAPRMAKRAMKASNMVLDRSKFEGRRIAENHHMQVKVAKESLQARYQRDMQQCIALGCDMTGSRIQSSGSGYLNARVSPEKLGEYLDFLSSGPGEVESHQVSATDKTMQYVDTESKLKNQVALRDRLLKLLDSLKARKIQEILNIERELTRVQSQIDSLTGQMRSLKKVTSKATVNVNYTIPPKGIEIEYHDIENSFRYAWNGFLRSVSDVISFVLKIIPWVPIWFIGGWLLVKIVRFAFRKAGGSFGKLRFWKKDPIVKK